MLKENRRTLIITSLVTMIPLIAGAVLWDRLPESLAIHFGFDGNPDGYGNKAFFVIGMPLLMLALLWLGAFITAHDPKKQNISNKMFTYVLWVIPAVAVLMTGLVYSFNLGYKTDALFAMKIVLGLMFVFVGNYMPKTRQNYTIGIRVPWTLADEENWDRTHRFAGFLWTFGGIATLVLTFLGVMNTVFLIGMTTVLVILPIVYSFWLSTKK